MYENVKPLQEKQLMILKEFKRVCEKNKLTYYLTYGTMIGAVRHHGFIPWDDDIDVMMPYTDYVKFVEVCKTDLSDDFFLQSTEECPEACITFNKLRMNGTTFIRKDMPTKDIHYGINIDIYPIYNVADDRLGWKKQYACTLLYMLLQVGEVPKNHGKLMRFGGKLVLKILQGNIRERIKNYCHAQMAKYENQKTAYKSLLFGNAETCRQWYDAKLFETKIEVQFEDDKFYIPSGYDSMLKTVYGDYMTLPPEEERGVKLDHIFIDTENSYLKYKGI